MGEGTYKKKKKQRFMGRRDVGYVGRGEQEEGGRERQGGQKVTPLNKVRMRVKGLNFGLHSAVLQKWPIQRCLRSDHWRIEML